MSDMDWNEELDEHEQGGNGNVDELISVLRQGYSIQRPEGDKLPAEPPEGASLPTDAQNFEPDFGNAFDDYGDYEQERPAPVQRTKKRKSHIKRLPFPFVVKLAIYLAPVFPFAVYLWPAVVHRKGWNGWQSAAILFAAVLAGSPLRRINANTTFCVTPIISAISAWVLFSS